MNKKHWIVNDKIINMDELLFIKLTNDNKHYIAYFKISFTEQVMWLTPADFDTLKAMLSYGQRRNKIC